MPRLRLLMVCLGNICRSPMAEGALRARLQDAGLGSSIELDSAGIGDWHIGQPPDRRAIAIAARHGVDLSALRARQLETADFYRFDWILCADQTHVDALSALAPEDAAARVGLLMEWAEHGARSIPDPYTGSDADFEQVWRLVDAAAHAIVKRLRTE